MNNLARKEEVVEVVTTTAVAETSLRDKALAELRPLEAEIADLEKKYIGKVYDCTTTAGMTEAKADRMAIRTIRYKVPKIEEDATKQLNNLKKDIKTKAAWIVEKLTAIENVSHEQITAEETRKEQEKATKAEAERLRVAAIRDNIQKIHNIPLSQQGKSSDHIQGVLIRAQSITIGDQYAEFQAEAELAKQVCIAALEKLHADTVAKEEEEKRIATERKELAKLRAEAEERDRQAKAELEVQEARLAAERKKIEDERAAEEKRIANARAEEEKKAQAIRDEEAARLAAERKVHEDKIRAEQEAAEKVRREQEEEQARIDGENAELARQKKEREEAEKARLARLVTCPKCGHEWEA